MMDCVPEEYRVDAATFKKHGKLVPMYDGKSKRMTKVFEVWGPAADRVFTVMPNSDRKEITRLDYRCEVPTPAITESDLYKEFKKVRTNARRRVAMYDSPERTKEDGRDPGGISVIVGTSGSKRRLACYKRGKERWALEVQFGDKKPLEIYTRALDAQEASSKPGSLWGYMMLNIEQEYRDAILAMSGHTYEEFAHLDFWSVQDDLLAGQERLLAKADEIWNRLDPEAQLAFITANVSPNGRYGVPVPAPVEPLGMVDLPSVDMDTGDYSHIDMDTGTLPDDWDEYVQGDW
jgi:hypothetical protein